MDLLNSDLIAMESTGSDDNGAEEETEVGRLSDECDLEDDYEDGSERATYGKLGPSLMADGVKQSRFAGTSANESSANESCSTNESRLRMRRNRQQLQVHPAANEVQAAPADLTGRRPAESADSFTTSKSCCDICKLSANKSVQRLRNAASVVNSQRISLDDGGGDEVGEEAVAGELLRRASSRTRANSTRRLSIATGASLGQKLVSSLERALVKPVIECLASSDRITGSNNDNVGDDDRLGNQFSLTMSIIMLCILIVLINVLLRLVDALSGGLIELLSFNGSLQRQPISPVQ